MSELALEELTALAAIYCEPDACEVLAVSGEGGRAPLSPGGTRRGGGASAGGPPAAPGPAPRGGGTALVACCQRQRQGWVPSLLSPACRVASLLASL